MTLVYAKVQTEAQAIIAAAALVAETFHQVKQVLRHNSNLAIDWGAAPPEYIEVDANGNLVGLTVTPAQIANAVGSMATFRDLFDNIELQPWQNPGDHMGNINQIIPAQTSRVSVRS